MTHSEECLVSQEQAIADWTDEWIWYSPLHMDATIAMSANLVPFGPAPLE